MHTTNRCIYCAFRTRQQVLRSRRLNIKANVQTSNQTRAASDDALARRQNRRADTDAPVRFMGKRPSERTEPLLFNGDLSFRRRQARPDFEDVLKERLRRAEHELKDVPLLEQLRKEAQATGDRAERFQDIWARFAGALLGKRKGFMPFMGPSAEDEDNEKLVKHLRDVFREQGGSALDDRIRYAFYAHLTGARFTKTDIKNQQELADLRYPSEWFPATRALQRKIHLHVGPTNSGKTYHALQRLEKANSGIYAGPLRLLAHEVYTRLNARGKPCTLITGEERRTSPHQAGFKSALSSCTVEMMPLNKSMEVAIIDEIQMIGSAERGWAWTQALMGVKAKEVHLCGEERTVPLIREICASLGEKLEIHRYERLSPLKMADESMHGRLKDLKKGDCIVSFSVMGIHALRRQIERATGKKVATVYGSLPPETRAQQARLFNDPDNDYDFLVASDAVGMGLNLAIKRIIFENAFKYDGYTRRALRIADIKQIAGRAGRYRVADQQIQESAASLPDEDIAAAEGEASSAPPPPPSDESETLGLVTSLEDFDFPLIRNAMASEPEPITTAGIFPPAAILERFAAYFPPSTPFSYILTRLHELSQMHPRFHLCGLKDQVWTADLIEPVKGLTIADRNTIAASPASKGDFELWAKLMPAYARCVAEQSGGNIMDIQELPLEMLDLPVSADRQFLRKLEQLHKGIVTYLWLSYRFAGIFNTRSLAFHVKGLVEERIEEVLGKFSFSEASRRALAAKREQEVLSTLEQSFSQVDEDDEAEDFDGPVEEHGLGSERDDEFERDRHLQEQTPLTLGGNSVGGEQEIAFDDPEQAEVVAAEDDEQPPSQSSVGSFALWRAQETRNVTGQSEQDDASPQDSVVEGGNTVQEAAERDEGIDDLPSIPEGNASQTSEPISSPAPEQSEGEEPRTSRSVYHGSSFATGMPPKHLHAHLDVDTKEMGRDADTRV
jgi:ATP-dependent RNA helicase SUPV3L1/SUV3